MSVRRNLYPSHKYEDETDFTEIPLWVKFFAPSTHVAHIARKSGIYYTNTI